MRMYLSPVAEELHISEGSILSLALFLCRITACMIGVHIVTITPIAVMIAKNN